MIPQVEFDKDGIILDIPPLVPIRTAGGPGSGWFREGGHVPGASAATHGVNMRVDPEVDPRFVQKVHTALETQPAWVQSFLSDHSAVNVQHDDNPLGKRVFARGRTFIPERSHYQAGTITVLDTDGDVQATMSHEIGHALDTNLGEISTDKEFARAFLEDSRARQDKMPMLPEGQTATQNPDLESVWKRLQKSKGHQNLDKEIAKLRDETDYRARKTYVTSDTLEHLIQLRRTDMKNDRQKENDAAAISYFKRRPEAFAELFANTNGHSTTGVKLKDFMPKSYAFVEQWVAQQAEAHRLRTAGGPGSGRYPKGSGGQTLYEDRDIQSIVEESLALHGPDDEPDVDHEVWRDHGPAKLLGIREVEVESRSLGHKGSKVWEGTVARDTIGFRAMKKEEIDMALKAERSSWASFGTFNTRLEGQTQISTADPRLLARFQKQRGYDYIVAVQLDGLDARSIIEPVNGIVRSDAGIGLGIQDNIPFDRIVSIRELKNNRLGKDVTEELHPTRHQSPLAPKQSGIDEIYLRKNLGGPGSGRYPKGSGGQHLGLHEDGTVTLLHGTTRINAEAIRQHGFLAGTPLALAATIEQEYGLPEGAVANHHAFQFAAKRSDLDRIHFTTDIDVAQQYTVPEVVQDALRSVWSLQNPVENVSKNWHADMQEWVKKEGRRLAEPEVLAVTVPWASVGEHAFGRQISLEEFKNHPALQGRSEILNNISLPLSALSSAKVATFKGAGGPGSGRYPKGSGQELSRLRRQAEVDALNAEMDRNRKPTVPSADDETPEETAARIKKNTVVDYDRHISEFEKGPGGATRGKYPEDAGPSNFSGADHLTFYHGTSSQAVESIKKNGLVPRGSKGADTWALTGRNLEFIDAKIGNRAARVFVTENMITAHQFASYAQQVNPGSEAVVLQINIPEAALNKMSPDDEATREYEAWKYNGVIPPAWIVGRASWGQDKTPTVLAGGRTLYVVVVADSDMESVNKVKVSAEKALARVEERAKQLLVESRATSVLDISQVEACLKQLTTNQADQLEALDKLSARIESTPAPVPTPKRTVRTIVRDERGLIAKIIETVEDA